MVWEVGEVWCCCENVLLIKLDYVEVVRDRLMKLIDVE